MPHPSLPPVVLEITPPTRPRASVLLRRADGLGPAVRVVNVISRLGRWASVDAAAVLRARDYDPVWHLANRGRGLDEIEREIERAAEAGLQRVLCIRGECGSARGEHPSADEPKIREVVACLRARLPAASIGVTVNHHLPGPRVLANLRRKLDAGADFVQTQVSFDLRGLRRLSTAIADRHPRVGVVPMLLPVLSPQAALGAARRLGIPLDQALHHALERRGAEAGWESFAARFREARHSAAFASVALMTAIDPPPAITARLREIVLGEVARAWDRPGGGGDAPAERDPPASDTAATAVQ